MTQSERLMARIKKLCKDNPGKLVGLRIIMNRDGEPFMWFHDPPQDVEGNDEILIHTGIKPTTRKLVLEGE